MDALKLRDDGDTEKCCWCGKEHSSGIYVREDPTKLMCKGMHKEVDVKNEILISTEKEPATDRIRVVVGAGGLGKRLVDGWLPAQDAHKLDAILNQSHISHDDKVAAIKDLVENADEYEEATYGHDKSKAGT
jgi:hypothetical protein